MIDLTGYTAAELAVIVRDATTAYERQTALERAPETMRELADDYAAAIGRVDGDPWQAPQGAHDSYREGATVTHDGKTWVSLIEWNAHAPGVSGWRELAPEGAGPAEWVQPTGAHDAYQAGDVVSFEGGVYQSTINGNVWSPSAYPRGWEKVA